MKQTLALIHAILAPPTLPTVLTHCCTHVLVAGKRGRGHKKRPEQLHTASTVLYVKRCSCSICSPLVFSYVCLLCYCLSLPCDCGDDHNPPGGDAPRCEQPRTLLLFGTFDSDSGFSCDALAPLFLSFFLFLNYS